MQPTAPVTLADLLAPVQRMRYKLEAYDDIHYRTDFLTGWSSRRRIDLPAPTEKLDVNGNINTTGVVKVDDVQVVGNRVIDARCDDAINSGDATTDGVIDALRDAMIAHGLIAAA